MNRSTALLVGVLLASFLPSRAAVAEPHRRALLVAVTNYYRGHSGDAPDLHTLPDVDALRQVLKSQYKFQPSDITVLSSQADTTHDAILANFHKLLIEPTAPGDIVYFHFSGHGAQVDDPTHRKPNGKHECLLPSDYVSDWDMLKRPDAKIPWGNFILDDDIRTLLFALKARQPGSVTLSFDSCFSGTITRGRLPVRGIGYHRVYIPPQSPAGTALPIPGGKETLAPGGLLDADDPSHLGYLVISATTSELEEPETDGPDGQPMGLLSWALVQALSKPSSGMTYRDLSESLTGLTTQRYPDRVPQIEGYQDREVFGTHTSPPDPYITVSVNDNHAVLNAGMLQGMTRGSRFEIYPPATRRRIGIPLAVATVGPTGSFTSPLVLDDRYNTPSIITTLNNTRAFETLHHMGSSRLRVNVSAVKDTPLWSKIIASWKVTGFPENQQAVQLLEETTTRGASQTAWDIRIARAGDLKPDSPLARAGTVLAGTDVVAAGAGISSRSPDDMVLLSPDGRPLAVIPAGDNMADFLQSKLETEARRRFVNHLSSAPSTTMGVKLGLLKANPTKLDAAGKVTKVGPSSELRQGPGGRLEFHYGDYFQLRITNTGTAEAFVTVLDLSPDGSINPVVPLPGLSIASTGIPAGASQVLDVPYVFRISPPEGLEVFKVIATNKPTDFSFVISRDAARGVRGELSPLQEFMRDAVLGQRGVKNAGAAPSDYAVNQLQFVVKP